MKSVIFHRISVAVIAALIINNLIVPISPAYAGGTSIPAQINKSFTPFAIVVGATSVMSVTIYNPNSFQLDNAAWVDNLVSIQPGLFIANPANVTIDDNNTPDTHCGSPTVTAIPGGTSISLSGGTVPPQVGVNPGSCTVSINVSSVTAGNLINTIPALALTSIDHDDNTVTVTNTTAASATLQVGSVQPPSLSKSFTPNTITAGQVSQLAIVITNNDPYTALTNTRVTDTFPANVVLANTTTTLTGCGAGTLTDSSGGALVTLTSTSVKLNNGTVAVSSTCTIKVNVTALTQGVYTNTISAGPAAGSIQTQQGVTNASLASAPLNVQQTVSIIKSFAANIPAGGTTTLTITLQNPTGSAYTGASFSDTLPGPLLITGTPSTTCGGTLTATAGTNLIQLSGGTIPASANPPTNNTCTVTIPVIAPINSTAGTYTNTIPVGGLTTTQGISNTAIATANIIITSASVTKAFGGTFSAGGTTTLTITLHNPSTTTALSGATISDTLPSPLTFTTAATPQCGGGTVSLSTTTLTNDTINLTGGVIPINGTCTIIGTVTAPLSMSTATVTNTIPAGALTTTQGATNAAPATANVTVQSITVTKAFSGAIPAGGTATLTITLQNLTASPYTGATISDKLPSPLTFTAAVVRNAVGRLRSPQLPRRMIRST